MRYISYIAKRGVRCTFAHSLAINRILTSKWRLTRCARLKRATNHENIIPRRGRSHNKSHSTDTQRCHCYLRIYYRRHVAARGWLLLQAEFTLGINIKSIASFSFVVPHGIKKKKNRGKGAYLNFWNILLLEQQLTWKFVLQNVLAQSAIFPAILFFFSHIKWKLIRR